MARLPLARSSKQKAIVGDGGDPKSKATEQPNLKYFRQNQTQMFSSEWVASNNVSNMSRVVVTSIAVIESVGGIEERALLVNCTSRSVAVTCSWA